MITRSSKPPNGSSRWRRAFAALIAGAVALILSKCAVVGFLGPVSERETQRVSQAVASLEIGAELWGMADFVDGFYRYYGVTIRVETETEIDGDYMWQILTAVVSAMKHPGIDSMHLKVIRHGSADPVDLKPAMRELADIRDEPSLSQGHDHQGELLELRIALDSLRQMIKDVESADS